MAGEKRPKKKKPTFNIVQRKDRVLYLTTDLITRNNRGQQKNIFSEMNNHRGQPKILHPANISFKDEGKIMTSLDRS